MVKSSFAALAVAAFGLAHVAPAKAQQLLSARVVAACGTLTPYGPLQPGQSAPIFMDVTGHLCSSATGGGGGGGPVTLASGAVAAGAYSAGAFVSGSFLSGALADGSIVTLGTKADTAWSSGDGTAIAILKKIAGNTASFSGAVTIAAGADVSEGNVTDTAWSGSGNSTVVAALKATVTQLIAAVTGINAGYDSGTNSTRISSVSQYPLTAVPITASQTGTTAATTATLTNVSGHTTFICGYSIRANATAAATVLDTVTGVITATMSSELWVAPAASGIGVDEQIFTPCIPANAVSTSINVNSGAPGAGGLVSVKAWGYSL